MVARSKAWVCGSLLTGTESSNPAEGGGMNVSCVLCSKVGPCVGPITRPEESYMVSVCLCVCLCVSVCVCVFVCVSVCVITKPRQ